MSWLRSASLQHCKESIVSTQQRQRLPDFGVNLSHEQGCCNTSPAGLEGGVVARGVCLVDAGTVLNVIGDQDHRAAEGAHLSILCVHLVGRRSRHIF